MWRLRPLIALTEVVWQVRARGITESACEGAKDVMRLDDAWAGFVPYKPRFPSQALWAEHSRKGNVAVKICGGTGLHQDTRESCRDEPRLPLLPKPHVRQSGLGNFFTDLGNQALKMGACLRSTGARSP
jgi:hypothetical protein